jgi:hypothetical protein
MRLWTLPLVTAAMLVGCASVQPTPTSTTECIETPTTGKVVNGHSLYGKGGEVFLVFYRNPKDADAVSSLRHSMPIKMLVVVDHPIIPTTDAEHIPSSLNVVGRNLFTGRRTIIEVGRHDSELGIGVEWGGNFEFPDAGCWELQLTAPRNANTTIAVRVL